ncbi:hypothetical protein GCM10018785_49600 [Streptomyces longispororuber]|uniref:Uncharacterized protein n=1 Tax=Streptomyces longispororuber TaxID=68230 RepID=A0A918ZYQ7_9ACTN|nr:hypothetical protein GCM10018785_49600 [Streptomyces longispororuber]
MSAAGRFMRKEGSCGEGGEEAVGLPRAVPAVPAVPAVQAVRAVRAVRGRPGQGPAPRPAPCSTAHGGAGLYGARVPPGTEARRASGSTTPRRGYRIGAAG